MQAIALCAVATTAEIGFAVQDCAELEGKSVEECAKYLAQPRASVEDRCVSYSMDQIGDKRYVPAAEILVQYVDYQIRDFSHERNFRVRLGLGRSGAFPAVDALFEIGRPAIVYLVNRLATEDRPGTARDNAVLALQSICRRNMAEAVSILAEASHKAADKMRAENLIRAARLASDKCPAQLKTQCISALTQQRRDEKRRRAGALHQPRAKRETSPATAREAQSRHFKEEPS